MGVEWADLVDWVDDGHDSSPDHDVVRLVTVGATGVVTTTVEFIICPPPESRTGYVPSLQNPLCVGSVVDPRTVMVELLRAAAASTVHLEFDVDEGVV